MARIPKLQRDQCSPDAQRAWDTITRCRPGVGGPFVPLIYNPGLAERVALLGEHIRFHGLLPPADRELAILTLARELGSALEWVAHEPIARREGVREEALTALRDGLEISTLEPREAFVIEVARRLARDHALDDELYGRGAATFGLPAWVELVTILGYYMMIGLLIEVFDIDPPAGVVPPAWSVARSG